LSSNLKELRLRQSAADSSRPKIGVAARGQGKLALHDDVGEV
jgi:hypothetical protein